MSVEKLQSDLELAKMAFGNNDFKTVQDLANNVIKEYEKLKLNTVNVKPLEDINALALLLLGSVNRFYGDTKTAFDQTLNALDIIEKNQLHDKKRIVYTSLGQISASTGSYDRALYYYRLAEEANEKYGEELRSAGIKNDIAGI